MEVKYKAWMTKRETAGCWATSDVARSVHQHIVTDNSFPVLSVYSLVVCFILVGSSTRVK